MANVKKKKLNAEQLKLLDGHFGFNPEDTITIIPDNFKTKDDDGEYIIPKDMWPRFEFRLLKAEQMMCMVPVFDALADAEGNKDFTTQIEKYDLYKRPLDDNFVAVENFYNRMGEEITIPDDAKLSDYIDYNMGIFLGVSLIGGSRLTEEEQEGL